MFLAGKNNNISRLDQRKRSTVNDIIYTSPEMAARIVEYFTPQFKPGQSFMEPCAGAFAIYDLLPEPKEWCEVEEGRDFLAYDKPMDWIITNFPWSGKTYRPLLRHACKLSDNVVHIIRAHNFLGTTARHKDYLDQGHIIKEIITVPWQGAFINKANEGFSLIIVHLQKNYTGDCKWSHWAEAKQQRETK